MATNIEVRKLNKSTRIIESEAISIFDKILSTDIPRSVFFIKGKVYSCPTGGRLESRYIDRGDSLFIGTYDNRATVSMIIDDLRLS